MIQKHSNNCHSEGAHGHQEQKGAVSLEFFKEHAHCIFNMKVNVRCEFVPPNSTFNSDFYCDDLRRLRENVSLERLEIWHIHNWLLHHDNAPTHTSLKTTEFVTNSNMVTVPHPPYSMDLAPYLFSLCSPN
jgi:hypothetical protein